MIGRLRRAWFPLALLLAVAIVFVGFGPPSTPPAADRLAAMAPAWAFDGDAGAPAEASPTETEIAEVYALVRANPDTPDALTRLGNAYLQRVREAGDPTDYDRAQAAFDAALRLAPDSADAHIGLGTLALARHDFSRALELGKRAVELAPHTARGHGVVVDALTELGRYDEAVESTQRMVDLRPDLASLSRVAYQRELRGDIDGAIDAMARAFDAGAGGNVENREYVRVLIGDLHLLQGDVERATAIYSASLEVLPGFVWAKAGLGRAAVARGDLAAAVEHYRAASDTLPVPELLVALGEAQRAAGDAAGSAATFELVRAMQALYAESGVNVGLELALFEANHGDAARAVELARQAYAQQPNVKAADALAWALHRSGAQGEAQATIDEALRLGTPHGGLRYHAGMIALAAGDTAGAREHLAAALAVSGTLSPLDEAAASDALEGIDD